MYSICFMCVGPTDKQNQDNFQQMQSSIFVLCLDKPVHLPGMDGPSSVLHQMNNGAGTQHNSANRWFDKILQVWETCKCWYKTVAVSSTLLLPFKRALPGLMHRQVLLEGKYTYSHPASSHRVTSQTIQIPKCRNMNGLYRQEKCPWKLEIGSRKNDVWDESVSWFVYVCVQLACSLALCLWNWLLPL